MLIQRMPGERAATQFTADLLSFDLQGEAITKAELYEVKMWRGFRILDGSPGAGSGLSEDESVAPIHRDMDRVTAGRERCAAGVVHVHHRGASQDSMGQARPTCSNDEGKNDLKTATNLKKWQVRPLKH